MKSLKIILLLVLVFFCMDANCQMLEWGGSFKGSATATATASATDNNGNLLIAGYVNDSTDFNLGLGLYISNPVVGAIYLCKLGPQGNLLWVKFLETNSSLIPKISTILIDSSGNILIYGDFYNTIDMDPGPNVTLLTYQSSNQLSNLFVGKYNSSGDLIWSKKVVGTNHCNSTRMVLDVNNDILLTGYFKGTADFDPGGGAYGLSAALNEDVFILKLNSNGIFIWAKSILGIGHNLATDIKTDDSGNAYIVGHFSDTADFDPGPGIFMMGAPTVYQDGFLLKLAPAGNFIWSIRVGNPFDTYFTALEIDDYNNLLIFGKASYPVDFDPGVDTFAPSVPIDYVFFLKLFNNGSFDTVKIIPVSNPDARIAATIKDNLGNYYCIGTNLSQLDPLGIGTYSYNAPYGLLSIAKYDSLMNYVWGSKFGPPTSPTQIYAYPGTISIDKDGQIYHCGHYFFDFDLDPSNELYLIQNPAYWDSYMLKIRQKGICGHVYLDINQNCISETTELPVPGKRFMIQPGDIVTQSAIGGRWYIDPLSAGTYTIFSDTTEGWIPTCFSSQTFTVVHPDSNTIAPSFGFISNSPCATPDISIYTPVLRPGFSNQKVYITACNGYTATGILDSAYAIVTLDPLLSVQSGSLPYIALGNNRYQVNVGDLYPGQCIDFWLSCTLSTNAILGQTLCMSSEIFPVDACVLDSIPNPQPIGISPCNTPWDHSSLSVEGQCLGDTVRFVIHNNGVPINGDMTCFAPIRLFIDGQFVIMDSIQLAGGDSIVFYFLGDGRTWRLEADQHPLHPGNSHPNATIELCGNHQNWTPGWYNILPLDDADPVIDIFCGEVRGSFDPNDKTGYPYGVDSTHNIQQNQDIEYVVRFQNTGTDTAFTVVVRDTLPLELDIFSVQSGTSSHDYNFRMYGPRILEWTFNNIMLPDSNVNEPLSNGFVKFKVKQNRNLPVGTIINNSAAIYFDFNAPVITNTYFHTVDTPSHFYALPFRDTIAATLCSNEPFNGYTYIASGQYFQPTHNNGTDSLHILDLTILQTTDSLLMVGTCDSFMLNGQNYTSSGIYNQFFQNAAGCDSTLIINLTIHNNAYTLTQTVCDSLSMNGQSYTNNGTYTQLLTNSNGCDSMLTINLTVLQSSSSMLSDSACDNYTLNGQTYTNSGTYTQSLTNTAGCDSTLTLNLSIENSTAEALSDSACLGYELNGQNYSISGTYTQVLTNGIGCDSILTFHLNILVDSTLTQYGGTLSSNTPNATYQWLDCNNSNTPIPGETGQTFIPTVNGNYAIQITQGSCTVLSGCYNVMNVGVEQVQGINNIRIYPNPTKNHITIDFGQEVEGASIALYSIEGKRLGIYPMQRDSSIQQLDLRDYPAGLYLLRIQVDGQAPQAFKVSKF